MNYIGKVVKIKAVELPSSMGQVLGKYGIVIQEDVDKPETKYPTTRPLRVITVSGQMWWFAPHEVEVTSDRTQHLFDINHEESIYRYSYTIKYNGDGLFLGAHVSSNYLAGDKLITSHEVMGVHHDGSLLLQVTDGHDGNFLHVTPANLLVDRSVFLPISTSNKLWWVNPDELTCTGSKSMPAVTAKQRTSRFQDKIDRVFVDLRFGNEYTLKSVDTTTEVYKYELVDNFTGVLTTLTSVEPRYPDGIIANVMVEKSRMNYHSLDENRFVGIHELERAIATMSKGGTQ